MQDIIPPRRTVVQRTRDTRLASRVTAREAVRHSARGVINSGSRTVRTVTSVQAVAPQHKKVAPVGTSYKGLAPHAKQQVLSTALKKHGVATKKKSIARRRVMTKKKPQFMVSAAIVVVLALTGYVAIDTWLTNRNVEQLAGGPAVAGVASSLAAENEGTDETKISSEVFNAYTVAPDKPRYLRIDSLNVAARVLPMSINSKGAIQAPVNVNDAGWYTGSATPGRVGAAFIDGHAAGQLREGLFAYLDRLQNGDEMTIEMGNGTTYRYQVVHMETVPLEELNMRTALLPHGNTVRGLNLMTCIGKYIPEQNTYDQRLVVYTEQIAVN